MGKLSKNIFAILFITITCVSYTLIEEKDPYAFEKDEAFMREAQEIERKREEIYEKMIMPFQEKKL